MPDLRAVRAITPTKTAPARTGGANLSPLAAATRWARSSSIRYGGTFLMQYRTLGRTGVEVSTLVLGAMNFGAIGRTTQDDATAMIDAALEAGINLIDTADFYSQGQSEEFVGKAIAGRRDDIVLATTAF